MAAFDPDAYLAAKPFDPDSYLGATQKPAPSRLDMLKKELVNSVPVQAALGAVNNLGNIGATLLAPKDALENLISEKSGAPQLKVPDRRTAVTEALRGVGANPDSVAFQGGNVVPSMLMGAGIGSALSRGAQAVPALARTGLPQALQTSGMSGGNLATRATAGAVTGGAAAGISNPSDAGTGAIIGAALPVAGAALSGATQMGRQFLGGTTGVGDEAINQAFQAGRTGGTAAQQFMTNLRGQAPMDDVLTAARQNLQAMGQQRQQAYRAGMANIKSDKAILSFDGIDDAIKNAQQIATFKGRALDDDTVRAVQAVSDEVAQWRQLDPAEFHTPEGLDALKQRIGSVLEKLDPVSQTRARKAVGEIYDSVKTEISKQAPEYAKVMREYSEATELIREIQRSLSLGQKASADTAMRKLQSLMRNNVNTSYGFRDQLAQQLQEAGGQNIMPALAGQAMSDWMPRGIQRAVAGGGGAGLAALGNIPAAAALAATSSPRVVGEGAFLAGRAAGAVNPAIIEALRRGTYSAAPVIGAQSGQ